MARRNARKASLSLKAVEAARPHGSEYTLWDGTLPHFGLRVYPSGRKSYIVQTRAHGRMRKITLGRFPELGLTEARRDAAAVLSRIWNAETLARVTLLPDPGPGGKLNTDLEGRDDKADEAAIFAGIQGTVGCPAVGAGCDA